MSICVGLLEVTSLGSIAPILNLFNSKNQIAKSIIYAILSKYDVNFISHNFWIIFIPRIIFKMKTISYGHFLSAKIGKEIGKKLLINFLGQKLLEHKTKNTSIINILYSSNSNRQIYYIFSSINSSIIDYNLYFYFFSNTKPNCCYCTFLSISLIYFFLAIFYKKKI